jgi:hypothetical protein
MARMIPAYCAKAAPPGEKKLFELLRDDHQSGNWVVFHSLGIANHERQVEGEADFVIVIPELGILVVEVKSHRSIAREPNGIWKLGNDAPTVRGPFQQAQEAKHSVIAFLKKRNVDLRNIPIVHAVWFTGVRARTTLPESPEWHDWQILDITDLENLVGSVSRSLISGTNHLRSTNWRNDPGVIGPNDAVVARIVSALRAEFEIVLTPGDRRNAREGQLNQFLEEQFEALDVLSDNRSVLIFGSAGTGKTFLAAEAARREIEQGRKGRLICFNSLLAKNLQEKLVDLEGLQVSTFHQELIRLSGIRNAPEDAGREFWEVELPRLAIEGMVNLGSEEVSDFLIVDEVQDLTNETYLDIFDLLVVGGLANGKIYCFGDFEKQTIYGNESGQSLLQERIPGIANFRLIRNCRNLPRIGYQTNLFSQLSPGYKKFRREDDGTDPRIIRYEHEEELTGLLSNAIAELRGAGFDLSEIVVLSPFAATSVAAITSDSKLRQILKPADGSSRHKGTLRFASIHAYKGLDSPAVILTDLTDSGVTNFDALLYVGLTRATDRLIALVETKTLRRLVGGR